MIARENIKWLQVENTTKCNAWCPGCSRNNNGYGLSNFVIEDLDTNGNKLRVAFVACVYYCGKS